jgi:hypothetical protein
MSARGDAASFCSSSSSSAPLSGMVGRTQGGVAAAPASAGSDCEYMYAAKASSARTMSQNIRRGRVAAGRGRRLGWNHRSEE